MRQGASKMEPARGDKSAREELPAPADAFFKETFSHVDAARSFFENYLPPALARQTDWNSLAREPESFLDANLRAKFADLLFSARVGGASAFFYVLLEHKSTPEYWTAFQILELIVRIWRKHLDNSKYARRKLPMIIPVVLHQGPKGWNHPTAFSDYIDFPAEGRAELSRFLVGFEHLIIDLSRLPWEEIKGEAQLRLAMVLMKAVRENRVFELLPKVLPLLAELGSSETMLHFLQALARYLMETEEHVSVSTIRALAANLPTETSISQIMTLAEFIREEGRNEGRNEGRTEGRQEGQQEGILIGQIITCREILGHSSIPAGELRLFTREELERMLRDLKAEVSERLK
jgi:predicted transposase/invertase (TIGR01784 family)